MKCITKIMNYIYIFYIAGLISQIASGLVLFSDIERPAILTSLFPKWFKAFTNQIYNYISTLIAVARTEDLCYCIITNMSRSTDYVNVSC